MSPDPIEQRFSELARRTDDVGSPPGFDARLIAQLVQIEAKERQSFWRVGQGAVGLALCTAIASLVLAVWHDARLTDELSRAPDAGLDFDLRDP